MAAEHVPAWFPVLFPFAFAAMWLFVTTLLAWFAGHMALVARHPPSAEPVEETFGWASGSMRGVSFNNALYVALGQAGLHLAPNALFRPIFRREVPCIPWREIRIVRAQSEAALARWIMGSKFEIPALRLRFALGGAAGRAVERRLASRQPGTGLPAPDRPRRPLVRER